MEMQLALTPTEVTTVPATLVIKVPVIQDFVKVRYKKNFDVVKNQKDVAKTT